MSFPHRKPVPVNSELDEIFYLQDWENGVAGWHRLDGFNTGDVHWQIDGFNPSPQNGRNNWRCFSEPDGFGENGGYENGWLQFLETDEIDLSESEEKK